MATGVYGIKRLANVDPTEIEVIYTYSPSRDSLPTVGPNSIDGTVVLDRINDPTNGGLLNGWYNLRLPVSDFSAIGFYSVMLRPKEIITTILDCGSLAAFPDVKGILVNSSDIPNIEELVGSRVEYFDDENNRTDVFRIITSVNRVEPVNQNQPNSTQKAVRYRFNNTSTLVFLTLTPSSAPNVKPNSFPFIGEPNQKISIIKTNFDPIMMEIEMVEHDVDTLAIGLFGNQTKSIQDGTYTQYDFNNNIYKQYRLYEIQDAFTNEPLYEVREERTDIDESKDFETITTADQ
jgi:hypothetical protein